MTNETYNDEVQVEENPDNELQGPDEINWLRIAKDAYRSSTNYYDSSLRRQWEKNLAMFQSKHPRGSKYHTEGYRHRSKIFRPKTRAAITRNEAQAAVAFFSTADLINIEAQNPEDPNQAIAAKVNNELLNYRLTETIPWFMTCIGAFQDSMVIGAVVSKQHWKYEERPVVEIVEGEDENGESILVQQDSTEVVVDKPCVDILPIENVRFDPAADWRDVVGTSPYFIVLHPMYLGDVKAKMKTIDPKTGQPEWKELDDDELTAATKVEFDSVRQSRLGNERQDTHDRIGREGDFRIVWVHENHVRQEGTDVVYWTLGTEFLLTDPVPLDEVYFHGMRPFVMGYSSIETHKVTPSGAPEIWEGIQIQANDITNQRTDNVRLALNSRYFVDRNANVDLPMLKSSAPGGVILMEDVERNVRNDRPPDVTASSYQEQDRLNVDFDEIAGAFSPGSVQTNRSLNETVGGMEMLSTDSNALTEYRLRIFSESWLEPVLRQLVALEQAYETDQTILNIAGQKAKIFEEVGIPRVYDWMLNGPMQTRVNVGFGNTNPQQRVEKLGFAMNSMGNMMMIPGVNMEEVQKEIFGALGYRDGNRFFNDGEDPSQAQIQQLQQQIQELQAQLQGKQVEAQARVQVAQIGAEAKLKAEEIKLGTVREAQYWKNRIDEMDKKLQAAGLKANNEIEVGKLLNQREALLFQMKMKESEILQKNTQDRMSQTLMNDKYGAVPGQEG